MKHLPHQEPFVEHPAEAGELGAVPDARDSLARHIATIQTLLQRSAAEDLDKSLLIALSLLGKAMQACRAYIFCLDSLGALNNTYEWCAEGVRPMQAQLQNVAFNDGDPFWRAFEQMGIVAVPDLERTRPESLLRQVLEGQDIRALLACALWKNDRIYGLIGLDFTKSARSFCGQEKFALRSLAATVSLSLQNKDLALFGSRTEQQLRATQARLSAAVSQAPRLLVETDSAGIITGFVQNEPLIFAMSPHEVIGAYPEQVLPRHVAEIVRRAIKEVDTAGHSAAYQYALDLAGEQKWFNLRASSRDPKKTGSKAGYLFVVTDISETRRQELLIRQLGRVAELSNNVIFLTDSDRKITWANPAGLARTGYDPDDILGLCPSEVFALDPDQQGGRESVRATLQAGESVNAEVECKSRTGISYWLDLNVQPLLDSNGGIQGYMLVGVDITAHKLAEARALREKMRTLDASREGYAILWPNGRVAFINTELRKLLGLGADTDTSALLWTDITSSAFTRRLTSILPDLMAQGFWNGEITTTAPDRDEVFLDLSLTVQDDGSLFAVVRDISARRQAEAEKAKLRAQLQISESRLVMSYMAAGLAHDLANLLAVISGSVMLAESQAMPSNKPPLARIRQASAQAQSLVTTLMQFGRAEARRERTDIAERVQIACNMLSANVRCPLRWDIKGDDLCTIADPTQVMQVIVNLVMNADQAMARIQKEAATSKITITVERQTISSRANGLHLGHLNVGKDYIVTTVTDQGPGIPQTLLDNLFAPFVTAGAQRGTGLGGTGLGMTIIAHIINNHGGALDIQTGPDDGTRISVYWPVIEPDLTRALTADASAFSPLAGLNVLLVDDDDQVLQHVSYLLTQAGAETVSCDNPVDALAAIVECPTAWDAVVTDYEMSPMDGLDLAQDIRRIAPHIRIVLVTGAVELQNAKAAGLDLHGAILRKPISGPELIAALLHARLRPTETLSLE